MRLKALTELTWRFYQLGKAYANNQNLLKSDIEQKIKLLFSDAMRQRYYESRKLDDFGRPDYSFSSPILQIKRFDVSEEMPQMFRRCDMGDLCMGDFDLYRLPANSHFTNLYPVGNCGTDELGEITQVAPGEENFYANDPDMKDFIFFVPKGRGLNLYNLPLCVKSMDIETTYDVGGEIDIDMSIASTIVDQVLNVALAIRKQYYSAEAKQQMEEQNIIK